MGRLGGTARKAAAAFWDGLRLAASLLAAATLPLGPVAALVLVWFPDLAEPWRTVLGLWALASVLFWCVLVLGAMRTAREGRRRFRQALGLRRQRGGWLRPTYATTFRGRVLRVRWSWREVRLELVRAAPSRVPSLRIQGPDREWQERPTVEARPPERAAVLHPERVRQLRSRRLPRPFRITLQPDAVVGVAPRSAGERPVTRLLLQLDELERETRGRPGRRGAA